MIPRSVLILSVLLAALIPSAAFAASDPPAGAPGCEGFTRDVGNELALLGQPGTAVVAGDGGEARPTRIAPGRRYDVRLHPVAGVTLAAAPGKAQPDDAAAGLLSFQVPTAGRYRVALTTGHWVDVIEGAEVLPSLDHEGRRGCPLLRKVVELDLPAQRELVVQVIGGAGAEAGLLVTPAGINGL